MNTLEPNQFSEFFESLHGYRPFRWQQRLAKIVATGDWPQALALPTASGKTACIDIAVFALACQADWPAAKRTAPRRIFFVVDRRIIVDEALLRAAGIHCALRDPKVHIEKLSAELKRHGKALSDENRLLATLQSVRTKLCQMAGGDDPDPLVSCAMRGGIYRDNAWARTPTQPTVICSTVDQIGSRLLFRGYGVGWGTRVVHAGLAANDALVLLDEAHCAKPFYQTGQAIRHYREWGCPDARLPVPFHFVVMSATPPAEIPADSIFPSKEEWEADLRHADQMCLADRIGASKLAKLVEAVTGDKAKSNTRFVAALVDRAVGLAEGDQHRRIGIIVNRVATAKDLAKLLCDRGHESVLLTGRMRGIDRDTLFENWRPEGVDDVVKQKGILKWFGLDEHRPALDKPIFIVATQCLEVGANLDFDALVTECASLDALRQRFGRLNRAGRDITARAAILIRADQVEPKQDDPIYGTSLPATWKWLGEVATDRHVDFGIAAFDQLLPTDAHERSELLTALQMPTGDAPVMLPAHVDCWTQTSPPPLPDPEPAIFLHGPQHDLPEVQLCWRADLLPTDNWADDWIDALALCPPSVAECLAAPLPYLRRYLQADAAATNDLADVETPATTVNADENGERLPPAVIWRGPEKSCRLTDTSELRPGDVVVFPIHSETGNDQSNSAEHSKVPALFAAFGHRPEAKNAARLLDCGDEANFASRGRAVLRLHAALLDDWRFEPSAHDSPDVTPESTAALSELKTQLFELISAESPEDHVADFREVLSGLLDAGAVPSRLTDVVKAIIEAHVSSRSRKRLKVISHPCRQTLAANGGGVVLIAPGRFRRDVLDGSFTNEDDSSSFTREVFLDDHLDGVTKFAQRFATGCGLSAELIAAFDLAAKWHDTGKQDERFQGWLRGGDLLKARLAPKPLAKSGGQSTRSSRERARARSGYPKGGRHELVSVRLLEQAAEQLAASHDRDLALHLIAAHHGCCRPFAPVIFDEHPVSVSHSSNGLAVATSSATELERLDSGVAERFWKLVRKYGWWGLAWLEAIFVLADHRRSEAEQQTDERETEA